MLVGGPLRPSLPPSLSYNADLDEIRRYLRQLESTLDLFASGLATTTVGLIGVRGFSSTGIASNNFVTRLPIGNHTSISWTFPNMESNASYLLFYSPSVSTGVVITSLTRTTTGVNFTFNPAVPSGVVLDCLLLR